MGWTVAVVSVLPFNSEDTGSNTTKVYKFYSLNCLKKTKINTKEAENWTIFKSERPLCVGGWNK